MHTNDQKKRKLFLIYFLSRGVVQGRNIAHVILEAKNTKDATKIFKRNNTERYEYLKSFLECVQIDESNISMIKKDDQVFFIFNYEEQFKNIISKAVQLSIDDFSVSLSTEELSVEKFSFDGNPLYLQNLTSCISQPESITSVDKLLFLFRKVDDKWPIMRRGDLRGSVLPLLKPAANFHLPPPQGLF